MYSEAGLDKSVSPLLTFTSCEIHQQLVLLNIWTRSSALRCTLLGIGVADLAHYSEETFKVSKLIAVKDTSLISNMRMMKSF